jgi:glutaredoxin 3
MHLPHRDMVGTTPRATNLGALANPMRFATKPRAAFLDRRSRRLLAWPQNRNETEPMAHVVMYTTAICPYCVRAKMLLQRKGVDYEERRIEGNRELMREMLERSQRRTVPQIFIDDYHVGGFDDLAELDMEGKLDRLLGVAESAATDGAEEV